MTNFNKEIFAKNLNKYLRLSSKTQVTLANDLGYSKSIVSEWFSGKKFPRIDAIQKLSDYFGIEKSDLIEDKSTVANKEITLALSNMTIYERIDLKISEKGTTKKNMCAEINLSYNTLMGFYRRKSENISLETIKKIATYLNTTVDYLVNGLHTSSTNAMKREDLLKDYILSKYKSLRSFALDANIPYTTVMALLDNDIDNAKTITIKRICDTLEIDVSSLINGEIKDINIRVNPQECIIQKYSKLNRVGRARVESYIDGLLDSSSNSDDEK